MDFISTNAKKKIVINPATFAEASQLKKEAMKCLSNANLIQSIDFSKFSNMEVNKLFAAVSELIINADSSTDFEDAVFVCLGRCSCDNIAITKQLFDDKPELREDYYEIVAKCCEENLRPFFKSLATEFNNRLQLSDTEVQASA